MLGLALSAQDEKPWPFEFLHPKRPPAPRNRRRTLLIRAGVAVAVLLFAAWGLRAGLIHQRRKAMARIQARIDQVAKNRNVYRDMRLRAKIVHDWVLDKRDWLDHYAYLNALLPGCTDVYASSVLTGSRGVLHLSIQARSGEILAQIDKRLREAGYDLKPLAVTPFSDRYGYGFASSLELRLPDKLKTNTVALKAPERPADDGSLEPPKRASRASAVMPEASGAGRDSGAALKRPPGPPAVAPGPSGADREVGTVLNPQPATPGVAPSSNAGPTENPGPTEPKRKRKRP